MNLPYIESQTVRPSSLVLSSLDRLLCLAEALQDVKQRGSFPVPEVIYDGPDIVWMKTMLSTSKIALQPTDKHWCMKENNVVHLSSVWSHYEISHHS